MQKIRKTGLSFTLRLIILITVSGVFFVANTAVAVEPGEILANPALEKRARAISAELRCMVCQNQSIDDSDAPLARDLRLLVRERLVAGDSDSQIINFLVGRYGEFILLKPRFNGYTWALWLGPFFIVIIAILFIMNAARKRRQDTVPLSEDEQARLNKLIDNLD